MAGDVNGDGFSDVIISAPYNADGSGGSIGAAFGYYGSRAGLAASPDWVVKDDHAGSEFGSSISAAGDVNGDGYGDVIIGAYNFEGDQAGEGVAYLYYGSAKGLNAYPDWTVYGDQAGARLGISVSGAGDINGDGYADLIIGAGDYSNGQEWEGRAYVYYGSSSGIDDSHTWFAESNQQYAHFGSSVSTAGDVNGDGYADVMAGASMYTNGQNREGRAFLYYGNGGAGLAVRPRQVRTDGTTPIAYLGRSDSLSSIALCLDGHAPQGRVKAKLEWQVAPRGKLFSSSSGVISGMSAQWRAANGQPLCETVSGLAEGTPYHWRVRLRYLPASAPTQPAGRWITMPTGGWNEARLRTAGLLRLYLPISLR